jgi:hypothetical protein
MTTDHDEIRRWAEQRGAKPACVRGTGGRSDTGMIRLDFPGYSGARSLQHISWDDWFESFDENKLALLHRGDNFNKLVSRGRGGSQSTHRGGNSKRGRTSNSNRGESKRSPNRSSGKTRRSGSRSTAGRGAR